jgi:hypothetical protein
MLIAIAAWSLAKKILLWAAGEHIIPTIPPFVPSSSFFLGSQYSGVTLHNILLVHPIIISYCASTFLSLQREPRPCTSRRDQTRPTCQAGSKDVWNSGWEEDQWRGEEDGNDVQHGKCMYSSNPALARTSVPLCHFVRSLLRLGNTCPSHCGWPRFGWRRSTQKFSRGGEGWGCTQLPIPRTGNSAEWLSPS